MKKIFSLIIVAVALCFLTSCETDNSKNDINIQKDVADSMAKDQPTPNDIEYSLERYNLIRRAYWVNGMREKAIALPCEIVKPLGYIYLFTESGKVVGQFTVDGKVSGLNSWLTPDYYYNTRYGEQVEMPDVDGSYGTNDDGIFFFTTDGKYLEWTGVYLYSDIPFNVSSTVLGGEE